MCKYCEKQKREDKHELVDLLVDIDDTMACIGEISPIEKRKHPDCEGEIYVYTDEKTVCIPIKYCPICGRKL